MQNRISLLTKEVSALEDQLKKKTNEYDALLSSSTKKEKNMDEENRKLRTEVDQLRADRG
jgi:predicted  nucleic acid-binding Zn-ribbon protein